MHSTKNFYTRLPVMQYSLSQLLEDQEEFHPVPADWYLIMTDIVNSTGYFKAEQYQEINLVAVSSVSVVLNVARRHKTLVPFIYGGDGATIIVPSAILADAKSRLATLRSNAKKRFGMDLRVSIIPVAVVEEAGFPIRLAKHYISAHYNQAVFLGEGIRYAEELMKHAPEYLLPEKTKQRPIDLSGLECEWNALFPPRAGDEVVSLIVMPLGVREPEAVFHDVLEKLDSIYGSFEERHPIHPKTLSPTTNLKTILHASHLKYGHVRPTYLVQTFLHGVLKSFLLSMKASFHKITRSMPTDMSTSSDTLKVDNTLKTVFAGTPEHRKEFTKWLNAMEKEGDFVYGLVTSEASVMTCYIKESEHMHIRFLDGFGGGYTLASIDLKKKLKRLNTQKDAK